MRRKNILSRRGFMRGALGAAAVSVTPILSTKRAWSAPQGTPGRFMVVVNLLGGNDGLNTVVPEVVGGTYNMRRPTIGLLDNLPSGVSLHDLNGDYKLHYSLTNFKAAWDDINEGLHVVQKVSYPSPNQSHFTSQDIMAFGIRDPALDGDGRGWLGRFADLYASNPSEPLGVIGIGVGNRHDFESHVTSPIIIAPSTRNGEDPVDKFIVAGTSQEQLLRQMTVKATLANESPPLSEPTLAIFNANNQAYDIVDQVQQETAGWVDPGTYPGGANRLGNNLRAISQLLHAHDSFQTRVFYTAHTGFDTHSEQHSDNPNNQNRHETILERLDEALGAFRDDMIAKNRWNDCVVLVISEFGRRNFENGSRGTDHGHGNVFFAMGGRVKNGVTGDVTSSDLQEATLPFEHDFRDVYANIIENHLGVNPVPLFPDPDYTPVTDGSIDLV